MMSIAQIRQTLISKERSAVEIAASGKRQSIYALQARRLDDQSDAIENP